MAEKKAKFSIEVGGVQQSVDGINSVLSAVDKLLSKFPDKRIKLDVEQGSGFAQVGEQAKTLQQQIDTVSADKLEGELKQSGTLMKSLQQETQKQNELMSDPKGYQELQRQKQVTKELQDGIKNAAAGMVDWRTTAQDNTQSFGELKLQLSAAKKELNTLSPDSTAFKDMAAEIGSLTERIKQSEYSFGTFGRNVGNYEDAGKSLRGELKMLQAQMASMLVTGQGDSDLYRELTTRAGQYRDALDDAGVAIRQAAQDSRMLEDIVDVTKSVAQGYSAMNGAAQLLGEGNEDLAKSMEKIQALMSVVQGLQTLHTQLMTKGTATNTIYNKVLKMLGIQHKENQVQTAANTTQIQTNATVTAQSSAKMTSGFAVAKAGWKGFVTTVQTGAKAIGAQIMNIPIIGWIAALVAALIGVIQIFKKYGEQQENARAKIKELHDEHVKWVRDLQEKVDARQLERIKEHYDDLADSQTTSAEKQQIAKERISKMLKEIEKDGQNFNIGKYWNFETEPIENSIKYLQSVEDNAVKDMAKSWAEGTVQMQEYAKKMGWSMEDLLPNKDGKYRDEVMENYAKIRQATADTYQQTIDWSQKYQGVLRGEMKERDKQQDEVQKDAEEQKQKWKEQQDKINAVRQTIKDYIKTIKDQSDTVITAYISFDQSMTERNIDNIFNVIDKRIEEQEEGIEFSLFDLGRQKKEIDKYMQELRDLSEAQSTEIEKQKEKDIATTGEKFAELVRKARAHGQDVVELEKQRQAEIKQIEDNSVLKQIENRRALTEKLSDVDDEYLQRVKNRADAERVYKTEQLDKYLQTVRDRVDMISEIKVKQSLSDFEINDNTSFFGLPSINDIDNYYVNARKEIEQQNYNLESLYKELFNKKITNPLLSDEQVAEIDTQLADLKEKILRNNAAIQQSFTDNGEVVGEVMQHISDGLMQIADGASSLVSGIFDMVNSEMEYEVEKLNEIAQQAADTASAATDAYTDGQAKLKDLTQSFLQQSGSRRAAYQAEISKQMKLNEELQQQEAAAQKQKEQQEAAQAAKEKQLKKQQAKQELVMQIIGGQQAVVNGLQTKPFVPLGIQMGVMAAALQAVQIATITSNMNRLADGGLLNGKRHSQGGIPVGHTGIEVEGGEYVVNRRSTAANYDLIEQINRSRGKLDIQHIPTTGTRQFVQPQTIMKMAQGGIVPRTAQTTGQQEALLQQVVERLDNLNINPVVSVVDIISTTDQLNRVKTQAGIF